MRQDILKIGKKRFRSLSSRYKKFINVLVDDWRGYRFVFDTEDVRRCNNRCQKCGLFQLLKNEKDGYFSSGLYPASKEDKRIFGPQNFLNCKTLRQYQNCYTNFLLKKDLNKKDLLAELRLIKRSTILYSKDNDRRVLETQFKNGILRRALRKAAGQKKVVILNAVQSWTDLGNGNESKKQTEKRNTPTT